ncbi:MAG: tetratricopeptide repeat protein [Verrucomicrobia bacterium]|jgi:predicted negative regulator of RcsB-dependent stress response|nr:tetratricopeptide repeat protein [Verrucomicrobiota bacterium]
MDAELTHSEQWLRFLAWLEDNWRRVAAVASIVIGLGVVVAFVLWQGAQKQRNASEALSLLLVAPEGSSSDRLTRFASDHAGTEAGTRALLLAGGALFAEGKYPEAQARFEAFLAGQPASPLTPKARLGVAACKEAQGQIDAAIQEYQGLAESRGSGNTMPVARFSLASLYVQQGRPDLARVQYEELARMQGSALAMEAQARLRELPAPAASASPEAMPLAPLGAPPAAP